MLRRYTKLFIIIVIIIMNKGDVTVAITALRIKAAAILIVKDKIFNRCLCRLWDHTDGRHDKNAPWRVKM